MKANNLLPAWRLLFAALLVLTVVLAAQTGQRLNIDTNLADITPNTSTSPQTKAAIDSLNDNIEKRIILLINGEDENTVLDAEEVLKSRLSTIQGISVQPNAEQSLETLVEHLKPYRFSLLSDSQRKIAAQQSAVNIAQQAKAKLFSISAQSGLLSFQDDPLGWHSDSIISLFGDASGDLNQPLDNAAVINLAIQSGAMNMRTQQKLTQALDTALGSLRAEYPVSIERSGVFFFAADAAKSSKQDISIISLGSAAGVVLLLLFVFRSFRALALPLVSVALGVLFAFVVTHSWYGKVHILTIVFGATLIGIVIDYSLHFFYHGAGNSQQEEVSALHRALLLSLMTSLIGYAALSFSELPALRKVAVFSCCGLFMAWLSVICLGDLALRKPLTREAKLIPGVIATLAKLLRLLPSRIWAGLALLMIFVAGLLITLRPSFSDDPRVFFKLSESLLASERRVADVANDYEPGRFLIITGANDDQVYQRHHALYAAISASEELVAKDFTSLLSWVPDSKAQNQNYRLQAKLYKNNGAAKELLLALSGELTTLKPIQNAYLDASNRRLTPDIVSNLLTESTPPVWFRHKTASAETVINFVLIHKGSNAKALQDILATLDGIEFINTVERTREALASQRSSASKLLMLAYVFVALLILLRYRSLASLWLVVVPITSSAMLIVLSTLLGFSLNLFHVMALFLVLGFGMDYTIFIREMSQQSAVTLQAILLSAITSLLSFGLLSISAIPIVASFGITLLVGNLFNLLGVIIYAQSQSAIK